MKQITILSHHLGLQGSYLNILDLNNYIQTKEKCKVLFYCKEYKDLYNVTRNSKRIHIFNELKLLKDYKPDLNAIVFTDFKTLIHLFKLNINIVCNKLFIMDNNEISFHLNDIKSAKFYHKNLNINRLIKPHSYNDIQFLIPPSNAKKMSERYPKIPWTIFFKRINWNLLKQIPINQKDRLYWRFDDIDMLEEMEKKYGDNLKTYDEYDEIDLWDNKGMIYYRRKHLSYYEQLGRLVFEFIMLGKEVHFLKDPFEKEDGLSDYIKHYNIQFDKNYKVITPANELIERMEMKYDFLKGLFNE